AKCDCSAIRPNTRSPASILKWSNTFRANFNPNVFTRIQLQAVAMSDIRNILTIEGDYSPGNASFALLVARFNGFIVDSLLAGAIDALTRHGVAEANITVIKVPGAFELPLVAKRVAQTGKYDAIIALGAVIRGSTPHFDYVAGECAKG